MMKVVEDMELWLGRKLGDHEKTLIMMSYTMGEKAGYQEGYKKCARDYESEKYED